jgi:uncharacterized membrane protein
MITLKELGFQGRFLYLPIIDRFLVVMYLQTNTNYETATRALTSANIVNISASTTNILISLLPSPLAFGNKRYFTIFLIATIIYVVRYK